MPAVIAPFVQQHVDHSLCVCVCLTIIFEWNEKTYVNKEPKMRCFFFLDRIFRLHIETTLSLN